MSNLTDFFPSGGGGLTPKFEEFNAAGTFTPTQALIDAGGYIEVFLVGGGGSSSNNGYGGAGGEVRIKRTYLTSVASCTILIGAGSIGGAGGTSVFSGGAAGGASFSSLGGTNNGLQNAHYGASFGAYTGGTLGSTAGSGVNGYGAGGGNASNGNKGGVYIGANNSGQGASVNQQSGSGYCLIKWYE